MTYALEIQVEELRAEMRAVVDAAAQAEERAAAGKRRLSVEHYSVSSHISIRTFSGK